MLWNQTLFSSVISFWFLQTPTNLSVWNFSLSGSVSFWLGSRNICTLEGRSKKVESQSSCLASLVSTKCWQECLAPALHLFLYACTVRLENLGLGLMLLLSYYCFSVTLQLLLLIAKTSLHGCTTLTRKPEGMSQVSACQEEKKQF